MSSLVLATSLAAQDCPPTHAAIIAQRVAAPLMAQRRSWTSICDQPHVFVASVGRAGGTPAPVSIFATDTQPASHPSQGTQLFILDGYLAEELAGRPDAKYAARCYEASGTAGVERLRGSFVLIRVDTRTASVELWTDRAGTRPCFLAMIDGTLVVAPELKCFRDVPGLARDLAPGSLAAMTMNGALIDEYTYYRHVQLVGPARHIRVCRSGTQITRYWQRTFIHDPQQRPPSAGEAAERICDATRRHLSRFRNPVLALSGGLDSRLILAACRRAGRGISAVTWGFDHLDAPRSDFQIAHQLAEQAGVEHYLFRLDPDELPRHAERVVYLTDGLTGHLGNYTAGEAVARTLAARHDALVRGDEMFGDYPIVWARPLALTQVGINIGKRLWLLRFLLRPDTRREVLRDYRRQRQALLDSIPPGVPPPDVTDIVFPRTRFPRVIASQSPMVRGHLEVVCPLLDNDVVDLLRTCTPRQREDKRYISACVHAEFPAEFSIPLNTVHSRTSWRSRFPRLGAAQRFLVETLLDPLPAFDEWFDRTAIRAWLGLALAEGARAPWPADSAPLDRGAARVAAFLLRPTFKERVVLNLATLKIWFRLFA